MTDIQAIVDKLAASVPLDVRQSSRFQSFLVRFGDRLRAFRQEAEELKEMIENYPLELSFPSSKWNPSFKYFSSSLFSGSLPEGRPEIIPE